jgi:hypothetical protein
VLKLLECTVVVNRKETHDVTVSTVGGQNMMEVGGAGVGEIQREGEHKGSVDRADFAQ